MEKYINKRFLRTNVYLKCYFTAEFTNGKVTDLFLKVKATASYRVQYRKYWQRDRLKQLLKCFLYFSKDGILS